MLDGIEEIWTEKYRPKRLSDMIGQKHIVETLKYFVRNKSLPHCLFAGPAGSGKTTAALCIARELFGGMWHSNFLELNASDERGIDTIRIKVKDFARTIPMNGLFKIIYLDEADSLTKDAQHALRRIMENYSHICRFILACNYSSKIIEPIQSRTAVFRFKTLSEDEIVNFLNNISKNENLKIDESVLKIIVRISEGDMRKAINILQMASTAKKITEDVIYSITNMPEPKEVRNMLISALSKDFKNARKQLISLLYERGLSGEDIIKEIYNQIYLLDIKNENKIKLIEKLGEYEFRLTEGSNPQIQLEAMLAQFALIGK
ncbi:MAG: replication factor C small subunit [Candidatus Aenigmatarchaeota archaeon]